MQLSRRSFLVATASGALVFPGAVRAATEIRLLVPGDAGSRTGRIGRMIATGLAAELGTPIEIVNFDEPAYAYEMLSQATADGRTLGLVAADLATLHWRGLSTVRPGGLTPLALMATDPAGIHVRAGDVIKTYRELAADLKSRPGARRISGAGRGAIWHLAATRWQQKVGGGVLPWSAASNPREAISNLVAGDVDIVVCSLPEARGTSQHRAIKTLGVMSSRRCVPYPEVPALSESGVQLNAGIWRGIAAPPNLPAAVRTQLANALSKAYVNSGVAGEAHRRGFSLSWADSRAFGSFMAREDEAMGSALRVAGLV